jgi:hypothetical protein
MSEPFEFVESGRWKVPLYLLQFDKEAAATSVEARKGLFDDVRNGKYRDVYVFAHGWNNDFNDSLELFRKFFRGFLALQPTDRVWAPVFVGVQWPSVVLVFPWEKGARIAGEDAEAAFQTRALAWIREELEKAGRDPARVMALAGKESLNEAEQRELAGLLRLAIRGDTAEMGGDAIPTQDELIAAAGEFQKASVPPTTGEFGFANERGPAGAQAAGFLSALDPRNLVRAATVYMMKDRAGIIGSKAVNPLITELTNAGAIVRLVGHSYGARVMLAALTTATTLARKVRSALLLQPAVNQYCFAEPGQIPGMDAAGGFRPALDQVVLPIYVTLSTKDFPLHETFHLALRRGKDLGEAEIAAGAPPSKFCALGGYGPQGVSPASTDSLEIADSGSYEYKPTARVVALDGSEDRINSHGDVTNRYTFWALSEQDRRTV